MKQVQATIVFLQYRGQDQFYRSKDMAHVELRPCWTQKLGFCSKINSTHSKDQIN